MTKEQVIQRIKKILGKDARMKGVNVKVKFRDKGKK
jgi:hypothetical protein